MTTLVLKHNGHEAHVPYELPDSLRFDCFVPDFGMGWACIDLRSEEIDVVDGCHIGSIVVSGHHPAVLEQAGDVYAVFELAFNLLERERAGWSLSTNDRNDLKVLSTIAEMAILESDLHTLWLRLPGGMCPAAMEPASRPEDWLAKRVLNRFITDVLVPRAQDLATAGAKRREAEWNEGNSREIASQARLDATHARMLRAKGGRMSRDDFRTARGTHAWRWIRGTIFRRHGLSWWVWCAR